MNTWETAVAKLDIEKAVTVKITATYDKLKKTSDEDGKAWNNAGDNKGTSTEKLLKDAKDAT